MQALPSHAVKANTSIHEMQGQLPHTVQTNAPPYVPFSSVVRDQVHSAQVNQGRFPMSVQTNASTPVAFYGVREQHDYFTPRPNQV
jgi:replication factor A2